MKTNVYNQEGKVTGETELSAAIFGVKISPDLIRQAILAQIGKSRVSHTHSKTRGEVRGGGKKPFAQKHTGQARQGSIRAPHYRHGGAVFAPTAEKNYEVKINKDMRQKAMLMALSGKFNDKEIVVTENLEIANAKTKEMSAILKKLPVDGKILMVLPKTDKAIIRAARNIEGVSLISANSLNILDILNAKYLLVFKDSIGVIEKTYKP